MNNIPRRVLRVKLPHEVLFIRTKVLLKYPKSTKNQIPPFAFNSKYLLIELIDKSSGRERMV